MATLLGSQSSESTEKITQVTCHPRVHDLGATGHAIWFASRGYVPADERQGQIGTGDNLLAKVAAEERITHAALQPWEKIPQKIEQELLEIAVLPAGWDGNGISAVTPYTANRTRCLLNIAYTWGKQGLPPPFMSPAKDGRMVLEWQNANGKELIVEIPSTEDEAIRFLLVEPTQTGDELEIESEFNDKWSTQTIVSRLLAKPQTANT